MSFIEDVTTKVVEKIAVWMSGGEMPTYAASKMFSLFQRPEKFHADKMFSKFYDRLSLPDAGFGGSADTRREFFDRANNLNWANVIHSSESQGATKGPLGSIQNAIDYLTARKSLRTGADARLGSDVIKRNAIIQRHIDSLTKRKNAIPVPTAGYPKDMSGGIISALHPPAAADDSVRSWF